MKLWRNNKVDQEWDATEQALAAQFLASPWADYPWPLNRKVRAFLTAPADQGGVCSVWDDEKAYDRLVTLIEEGITADGAR